MRKIRAAVNVLGALLVGFILTTCVVAAFACGSPQEPDTSITGVWSGNTTYGDSAAVPVTFRFDLVDRQGEIRGSGLLNFSAEETYGIEVDGIRDKRAVNLDLVVGRYYAVEAQGSVNENTLTLTLWGSGFHGEQLVLVRSP